MSLKVMCLGNCCMQLDHKLEDFSEIWKASFVKIAFSKVAEEFF